MSISGEVLEFLKRQVKEPRIQQLLETKGYLNPQADDFGINPWTIRLTIRLISLEEDKPGAKSKWPDHFVSFVAIPEVSSEEIIDFDSDKLLEWVSEYQWHQPPGIDLPFPIFKFQACNDGMLLPRWNQNEEKDGLEKFLLIQRNGIVEFGLGQNAYYTYQNEVFFRFIPIVGRFWQFLTFVNHFLGKAFPDHPNEIHLLINLRGTKDSLLTDLAEGWAEPRFESLGSYRPKCLDMHLQIRKKIATSMLDNDIEKIVRWFATRIDNAWGQFEPRCYVHQKRDASKPFAMRTSR